VSSGCRPRKQCPSAQAFHFPLQHEIRHASRLPCASIRCCHPCLMLHAHAGIVPGPALSANLEIASVGGHIVHLGSALGQLDALPLAEYKESIREAKTIQELMDLRYPADEIAKVRAVLCPP